MREGGFAPSLESLPPHAKNTSPYYGEGDKAGSQENQRFFWVLKGGEVDKQSR